MPLQSSGPISLNDIHIEVGGTSGTAVSINDSDIRDLISSTPGTPISFSDFYGASAAGSPEFDNALYAHFINEAGEAGIVFNTDGSIDKSDSSSAGNWDNGNTGLLTSSDYDIRIDKTGGNGTVSNEGIWLNFASNTEWSIFLLTTGTRTFQGTVSIRDTITLELYDTTNISLSISVSGEG